MDYRINIVGEIGWDVFPSDIQPVLDAATENDTVYVSINSGGGYVFDGMTIYDNLRLCKAKIVTINAGMCASIASVIFMAGDTMISNPNAMFMVHQAWTFAAGNAEQLREQANQLEAIDSQIKQCYAERRPQFFNNPNFENLYTKEQLFTGKQALEYNMIDNLTYENKVEKEIKVIYNSLKPKIKMSFFSNLLGAKSPKNMVTDTTLADGTAIQIESESGNLEVGAIVRFLDGAPAPEGEHTLTDGSMFKVDAEGIVVEVMEAITNSDKMKEMEATLAAKEIEITDLKAEGAAVIAQLQTEIKNLQTDLQAKNAWISKVNAPKNIAKPAQGSSKVAGETTANTFASSNFINALKA